MDDYSSKSFWLATYDPYEPNPRLEGDIKVDVAVVGGGFTGLATAYFIKKQQPSLRVAVLESEVVGFGASGRNAGFSMTLFGLTMGITAFRFGKAAAREAQHEKRDGVTVGGIDELGEHRLKDFAEPVALPSPGAVYAENQPAIHAQHSPIDKRGLIGGQEQCRAGDVDGLGDPAERISREGLRSVVRGHFRGALHAAPARRPRMGRALGAALRHRCPGLRARPCVRGACPDQADNDRQKHERRSVLAAPSAAVRLRMP